MNHSPLPLKNKIGKFYSESSSKYLVEVTGLFLVDAVIGNVHLNFLTDVAFVPEDVNLRWVRYFFGDELDGDKVVLVNLRTTKLAFRCIFPCSVAEASAIISVWQEL